MAGLWNIVARLRISQCTEVWTKYDLNSTMGACLSRIPPKTALHCDQAGDKVPSMYAGTTHRGCILIAENM